MPFDNAISRLVMAADRSTHRKASWVPLAVITHAGLMNSKPEFKEKFSAVQDMDALLNFCLNGEMRSVEILRNICKYIGLEKAACCVA